MTRKWNNKEIGKWGEDLAYKWLGEKGLIFLERNIHTPHGEIDLAFMDGNQVVFVEVKTRTNTSMGYPENAIDQKKFSHLVGSIAFYYQQNPDLEENWRIDILAVVGYPGSGHIDIRWFKNVTP